MPKKISYYREYELIMEVIRSPEASPYALSVALHDKGIRMLPQTIYNYLDAFEIRDIKKRKKLRAKFLERFKAA